MKILQKFGKVSMEVNRLRHLCREIYKSITSRRLRETSWDPVKGNPNESSIKFIETSTQIYDDCFPIIKLIHGLQKAFQSLSKANKSYMKNS